MKQCETTFSLSIMSIALFATLSFSSAAMAADSDGDGLDDSIERMYGWNPYDANSPGEDDYDRDGLTDLTEYKAFTNIYDPNNPVDMGDTDDDGDTLPKGLEVFLMGTDPDKADTDCDGDNDNVDANPVDGVCEIPEPNPESNMTDDIRTSEGDSEDQLLAPTVPLQLYYAVEYSDSETHSTENIDPDSNFMTWSLSDDTYASIDENTGIFEFYNGTPVGTEVMVTATHIDNDDITDTMLITSTIGIPDVNGTLTDDIRTDLGDSNDQTLRSEVPLQLYYAVDYSDGETYSTENVALDSDVMTWSLSNYSDASIDADTGVFEFKPGTLAGTQVTVTATANENSVITDTIEIFAATCIAGESDLGWIRCDADGYSHLITKKLFRRTQISQLINYCESLGYERLDTYAKAKAYRSTLVQSTYPNWVTYTENPGQAPTNNNYKWTMIGAEASQTIGLLAQKTNSTFYTQTGNLNPSSLMMSDINYTALCTTRPF